MGEILCADGVRMQWKHSDAPVTTVRSDQLKKMAGEEGVLAMLLAHAECTSTQIASLYRHSRGNRDWGRKRRRTGLRIKLLSLQVFCVDLGETTLHNIVSRHANDREGAIRSLMMKA